MTKTAINSADPNSPPVIVLGPAGGTPSTIAYTEDRMAALEDAAEQFFGQGQLTGFTLFEHIGRGWQMSVRPRGEVGWIVKIIHDDDAKAILDILSTDPRFKAGAVEPRTKASPIINSPSLDERIKRPEEVAGILLVQMKAAELVAVALTHAIRERTAALLAETPL